MYRHDDIITGAYSKSQQKINNIHMRTIHAAFKMLLFMHVGRIYAVSITSHYRRCKKRALDFNIHVPYLHVKTSECFDILPFNIQFKKTWYTCWTCNGHTHKIIVSNSLKDLATLHIVCFYSPITVTKVNNTKDKVRNLQNNESHEYIRVAGAT